MAGRGGRCTVRAPCFQSDIDLPMAGTPAPDERPLTILESALRHDRVPLFVLVVLLPVVSWLWIVVMARDMYGPMTGASAWMMTATWDIPHLALLWAMWAVMMAGMMLPSASPVLLLYGVMARRSADATASRQIYALAAGYLIIWTVFSLAAAALQRGLVALLLVSPMMETTTRRAGAALLFLAGAYQVTPLKRACLRTCQSPLLTVIVALTAFVAVEKLAPFGMQIARIGGVLLMAAGVWMAVR
jgi:predicted metal-binding membrane protein